MSRQHPGPLSADLWNPIIAELEDFARQVQDDLMRAFYESGHPLGTEPLPDAQVYENLVQLRDAGSPMFWQNPQAAKDLERLSAKFGAPGPVAVPNPPGVGGASPFQAPPLPQLALTSPVPVPVGGPGVGRPAEYPSAVTGGR